MLLSIHVDEMSAAVEGPAGDGRRPIMIVSRTSAGDFASWTAGHRPMLERIVERHKAILLRGFGVDTVDRFSALVGGLGANLLEYSERSTPRSTLGAHIYTSTEYPNTDEIPMHNENSYSRVWPRRLFFCCLTPPAQGGATSIADSRTVFEQIPAFMRDTFLARQVRYIRNYGQGLDLTWREAFQTDNPRTVETYCRSADIAYDWFGNGECLHTEQIRPAALRDMDTGESVWFNQAHLFHVSSLEPSLRAALCDLFPADRLPRHASYGNGDAIDEEILDAIRDVYRRVRVLVEWQRGDVLLLDNLFYAHGRLPFRGERKVIVAMDTVGGPGTEPL